MKSKFSEVHTIGLLCPIIRLYSKQCINVILPMVTLHCLAMGKHTSQAFPSRTQFSHAGFSAQISFLISYYNAEFENTFAAFSFTRSAF